MHKRSNEAVWWSLFAAGGGFSALLMPITILLTGIALPLGWISQQALFHLLHNPLARLYLFAMISLPLFHGVHRLIFALADLGLHNMKNALAVTLHGFAVVVTLLAAILLFRF
jgi:fumarate reductase subunit D